jgi:hypothetical protein
MLSNKIFVFLRIFGVQRLDVRDLMGKLNKKL